MVHNEFRTSVVAQKKDLSLLYGDKKRHFYWNDFSPYMAEILLFHTRIKIDPCYQTIPQSCHVYGNNGSRGFTQSALGQNHLWEIYTCSQTKPQWVVRRETKRWTLRREGECRMEEGKRCWLANNGGGVEGSQCGINLSLNVYLIA
jgi:hypothetical protein